MAKARSASPGPKKGATDPAKGKSDSDAKRAPKFKTMFTGAFVLSLLVICSLNTTVFYMTCCIGTAFAALCFVWESKDKEKEKLGLACAVAVAALVLLFFVSGKVHTDSSIKSKIAQGFPDAERAYEFCRTLVQNAEGWAAEDGLEIKFVRQTPWSAIFQ